MKAWSLFYPDILPELTGAPLPMVDHWLRNAAIEFCERSKAHRVNLTAINAVAEQMPYALAAVLPTDTALVEIITVWYSGEKITPKSPLYLEDRYDDWTTEIGTPEFYTQQDSENILLVPAPAAAETSAIKIRAAIKPDTDATGVYDWLFANWRWSIGCGAKAKLLAMDKVSWANPDKATLAQTQFDDAIAAATTAASVGLVRSRPRFSGSFC